MFPSAAANNTTLEGQAEMELDSGDGESDFENNLFFYLNIL